MSNPKFTIGQTVYKIRPSHDVTAPAIVTPLTITRIGRKWVEAGEYRFDLNTLQIDGGGYNHGHVYLSPEEYETEQAIRRAWGEFTRKLQWGPPPKGVTLEAIEQAAKLLEPKP
jgi:hypothetical protein